MAQMKFAKEHPILLLLLACPIIFILSFFLITWLSKDPYISEQWYAKVFLVLLGGFLSTLTTIILFYYQKIWEDKKNKVGVIDSLVRSFDALTSEYDDFVKHLKSNSITATFYPSFKKTKTIAIAMRYKDLLKAM